MSTYRHDLGRKGEQLVAQELVARGFKILGMNVTTRWSEIDIVAYDHNIIHCIEVKTRIAHTFGFANEALTKQKFLRIGKAAQVIRKKIAPLVKGHIQIDFAAVELRGNAASEITVHWNIGPMDFSS